MEGRVRCWLVNQWKPGQGEVGRGHLEGPNLPLHPQFSKDVLVNIYSAYIDNFLNAKDAVRVAKEARPAFLKFLEVPGPGRGMEATLLGSALGVSGAPILDPRALACGSVSPLRAGGAHWGPVCPWTFPSLLVIPHLGAHQPYFGFQQSMRENKEKQALSDLMIKPVQRIPRYELLVKVGMGLGGQVGVGLGGQEVMGLGGQVGKVWRHVGMQGAQWSPPSGAAGSR